MSQALDSAEAKDKKLRWIDDYRRPPNPSPHGIGERVTGARKRDVSRQTVRPMASFSALARPV